ncbi:hypothetical protein BDR05DRAFT_963318 [Suillus weaverae]|nr:hypothetical protein BDR05DRAFT_963318 [Suillus weaverae]
MIQTGIYGGLDTLHDERIAQWREVEVSGGDAEVKIYSRAPNQISGMNVALKVWKQRHCKLKVSG